MIKYLILFAVLVSPFGPSQCEQRNPSVVPTQAGGGYGMAGRQPFRPNWVALRNR